MIEAVKCNIETDVDWKEFLRNQYNLFYDHNFIKYNDVFDKNIIWHHIKIKESETPKILSIINGCEIHEDGKKIFLSSAGVSFGGFLWKYRTNLIDYIKIIRVFNSYLKVNGFSKVILRCVPFLYSVNPDQEGDYALLQCGYNNIRSSITNIVSLKEFDFAKIPNARRRAIKNASVEISVLEKPVTDDNFSEFYDLLVKDRALKNVKPTHSKEELMWLKNNLPDNVIFMIAKISNRIIAICVLFIINKNIVLNFYLAADKEYQKDNVSEYILYKSIEWSKQNSFNYYDIGTSDINNQLLEGVFTFKKRFLANGFLRNTFEVNL